MGESEIPVLVVGAGPTGLQVALELASRAVPCRIIDKTPERSDKSRAFAVQARTLELFQKHGFADELVARGQRTVTMAAFVNRRLAFEVELTDIGVDDTPYPFILFVSQAETERLLERALNRRGVTVERPVELDDLVQDTDAVRATLRHARCGSEIVSARYIVGCDGAHSTVREKAGLRFQGGDYPEDFILADVRIDWKQSPERRLDFFLSREGLLAVFPLGDSTVWRMIASRARVSSEERDPSLEDFQTFFDEMSPLPARLHDPTWLARFRLHHRRVERYRAGRVFVAGDAAHIHSPAGGQGMNTGIQDGANLGWKLGLVVSRGAMESLLDSYETERLPIGRQLLRTTDRLFAFLASRNRLLLSLRNLLVPLVPSLFLTSRRRRAAAFRLLSELGIRYPGSPIVAEDLAGADRLFRRSPAAGDRAPDAPVLREGADSTLFAGMTGVDHQLLLFAGETAGDLSPLSAAAEQLSSQFPRLLRAHLVARHPDPDRTALFDSEGAAHRRLGSGGRVSISSDPMAISVFARPALPRRPPPTICGGSASPRADPRIAARILLPSSVKRSGGVVVSPLRPPFRASELRDASSQPPGADPCCFAIGGTPADDWRPCCPVTRVDPT